MFSPACDDFISALVVPSTRPPPSGCVLTSAPHQIAHGPVFSDAMVTKYHGFSLNKRKLSAVESANHVTSEKKNFLSLILLPKLQPILAPPVVLPAVTPAPNPILSVLKQSKKTLTSFERNQTRLKKAKQARRAKALMLDDPFSVLMDSQVEEANINQPPAAHDLSFMELLWSCPGYGG